MIPQVRGRERVPQLAHKRPVRPRGRLRRRDTPGGSGSASPLRRGGQWGRPRFRLRPLRGFRRRSLSRGGRSGEPNDTRSRLRGNPDCVLYGGRLRLALKSLAPSIARGRELTIQLSRSYYAGAITTKRRGSSPSERVTIPSTPVRPSWMALRSAGDMGSSERSSPVSMTS